MEENIEKIDIQTTSMQTLAFIGDAVHNLYIRTYLASKSNVKTGLLHRESIKYVSAVAQARTIEILTEMLTEEEINVYKRGRNTNIEKISKSVDIIAYKKSTGFESLIGYLYITKKMDRLKELLEETLKIVENKVGGTDDGK